jgi:hypothetical protein
MIGNMILKVKEILDHEGWKYVKSENDILLVASWQTRKWRMVISCEEEGQVCCFAVYPWNVTEDRFAGVFKALNELNMSQRRGCFMMNTLDMRVIYRCGVHILDEYTSHEYIKHVLLSSVASVNANWEKVYGLICGIG